MYEWLTDEFLPRVRKTLDRVPCLAFIALPDFWRGLQTRNYAQPSRTPPAATFRANWFTDQETALAWLHQFRPAFGAALH